jgi:hypothetical protein
MIGEYCKIFKTSDRNHSVEIISPPTERPDDDFLLDELSRIHGNDNASNVEMTSQQGSVVSSIININ